MKCCCLGGVSQPQCGECGVGEYGCCPTVRQDIAGYTQAGSTEGGLSGTLNTIGVSIQGTRDHRRRVTHSSIQIPIPCDDGFENCFYNGIIAMTDTGGNIRCNLRYGPQDIFPSNGGLLGAAVGFDAVAGTAAEYIQGGIFPEDHKPLAVILGEEMQWWAPPLQVLIYENQGCCAGSLCDYDEWPGPSNGGFLGEYSTGYCVNDPCFCGNLEGIDCSNDGIYTVLAPQYNHFKPYMNIPATGAALSLTTQPSTCTLRIEGFVQWKTTLPWGANINYIYNMGAIGIYRRPPADCSAPPPGYYDGICPQQAEFRGYQSQLANANMWTNDGACGLCFPDIDKYGGFYTEDCRCDQGAYLNGPDEDYEDCPPKTTATCASPSNPSGIYYCDDCDNPILGGHYAASIG